MHVSLKLPNLEEAHIPNGVKKTVANKLILTVLVASKQSIILFSTKLHCILVL